MNTVSTLPIAQAGARGRPLVSAIMAVRNEKRHIETAIESLLKQETPGWEIEIIVVDGNSSDGTGEIVERIASHDSRVTLAINEHRNTPYAFNLGIQRARGEYICILGAHTKYAHNYIATCLEELKLHGAAGCSGRLIIRPGGDGLQARLVAWTLAHPFGTSARSMRTRGAGFADTIPYPIFLKRTLLEVGGYNTQLHRNQDNDLSQRLRARGYTLYLTDKTTCEYFVSSNLASLARYAFNNGFWNIISFKLNPASMSLRHFVPGAFVVVLFLGVLMLLYSTMAHTQLWLRVPILLLGLTYGVASVGVSSCVALQKRSIEALLMPITFLLLHVFYGTGTLTAVMRNARSPSSQ
ncbi:glycosyltransferase family 2 protein [Edaphobacter aggregans]|uniref:glycosyltransferase family 2 protein n=1 Tax=Edaphobacter aggregans TaxID=570835 RepID=UPI00054E2B5B|nr:glycosyltransferase family 2 protein [Edaphobacter aggregans]